jgi:hypothetical protein
LVYVKYQTTIYGINMEKDMEVVGWGIEGKRNPKNKGLCQLHEAG